MAQYPLPKLPSLVSVHASDYLALKCAECLVQLLIWSSVRGFKMWWQKQWGRENHVGVKLATTLFALRRERTAFVMVLWCLSQSKRSLILCKLLLVQIPVWWQILMMPNPNFNIHSQTKVRWKGEKPKATPEHHKSCFLLSQMLFFFQLIYCSVNMWQWTSMNCGLSILASL